MIQMLHRFAIGLVALCLLAPLALAAPPPSRIDVVTNGGFEDTDAGAITDLVDGISGWTLETGADVTTAPDYAVVSDGAYAGDRALSITVNAAGVNSYDIQAIAEPLPVTPGETYTYSVWAKAATAGAAVDFTMGNKAFAEYGRTSGTLTTEWTEYTFLFTVTDSEDEVRAPIHVSFAANVGNTIFLDDLTIALPPPIANEAAAAPAFRLAPSRPNPASAHTTIGYELDASGIVSVEVFNTLGQRVATLVDAPQTAGAYAVTLDTHTLSPGVYVYRLQVDGEVQTRRLTVVR